MTRNVKKHAKYQKRGQSASQIKKTFRFSKVFFRKFLYCFTFELIMNEFFRYMTHQINCNEFLFFFE